MQWKFDVLFGNAMEIPSIIRICNGNSKYYSDMQWKFQVLLGNAMEIPSIIRKCNRNYVYSVA